MEKPTNLSDTGELDEIYRRRKQLAISLKFHHYQDLQKLPQEVAVRAMAEAWGACHPEGFPKYCPGTSTAIIPQEQISKSIRESKYFSG
ncbi:hypothetical protein [Acaryochloris marina]|uniref:Uncharacterized protein n=1 Tax=Acaryochloris marina (strain MBIC 11017) TaxID=329726 RepID=A8ZL01_ACAM1|nr:hypothetical protein [Acaryochloris marina]ABW31469.1 hypothetical protein AM1_A0351 [Acaryochloris marina MBIC11017]BDM83519.1 hypothetical protein AM10699_63800 [Acaryochloris marina MBIC10699]